MKERILYHCEICGFESESKEEVLACETRGKYPAVKVGDIVQEFDDPRNIGIVRKLVKGYGHNRAVLAARVKSEALRLIDRENPPAMAFIMGMYGCLKKVDIDVSGIEFMEPVEFPVNSAWKFEE